MLVSMKYLLDKAKDADFAVGAFNATELALVRSVVEQAEESDSPAIIEASAGEFEFVTKDFYKYVIERCKDSRVPFALHLDHGHTVEECVRAIQAGFTSVMIDGSTLPYEENVALTKKVVEIAHAAGVTVEGEIGTIGAIGNSDEGGVTNITYTRPEDVVDFVEKTGVDCLAIAIGTAHGKYPSGYVPVLDFGRLKELKEALKMPLVLHGGSGSGEENIRKAVANGINKINVCTDAFHAAEVAMKAAWEENPGLNYMEICAVAEAAVKQFVKDYIRVIGSNNRYTFEVADNGSKE